MPLFSRHAGLLIRPARADDLPELRRLIEISHRVHLHLDWWTLEDWVGTPGLFIAQSGKRIAGLGLGAQEVPPTAWLRALAMEDGLDMDTFLDAVLLPLLDALHLQGVSVLACLAWADWLADRLPQHGFAPMTRVMTLRREDATMPDVKAPDVLVREATPADLDAITAIDYAAFDAEWQYSATTFLRVLRNPTRFIMAEWNGQPVGYAFAHLSKSHAHITRLGVHPSHQGRGIGARLMADLVAHAMAHRADTITLNTQTDNEDALRLYRRFGFAPMGNAATAWRRWIHAV